MNANKKKLRPISAQSFIAERDALTKSFNAKLITAAQHKRRFDVLVARLKLSR